MFKKLKKVNVKIKEDSLVILIGGSSSGKSTFSAKFGPGEVISSDYCRFLVSGDEADQSATVEAFKVLNQIASGRMKLKKRVVVDSTALHRRDRIKLIKLAKSHGYDIHAIVFDVPLSTRLAWNQNRPNPRPVQVLEYHENLVERIRGMSDEDFQKEGVATVTRVTAGMLDAMTVQWVPSNSVSQHINHKGPFDIVGDIHGCIDEFVDLLESLGYADDGHGEYSSPDGRTLVVVGDLVDRGPDSATVVSIVAKMVLSGNAIWVKGNHDCKMIRALRGNPVKLDEDLKNTLSSMRQFGLPEEVIKLDDAGQILPYAMLDGGNLIVAHAGLREDLIGRTDKTAIAFAKYGDVNREALAKGRVIRNNWAEEYGGTPLVVYGHVVVERPLKLNNTINVDTGCVFGGELTALRYPEMTFVSAKAQKAYAEQKTFILA